MSNVTTLPGMPHPDDATKPNEALCSALRQLLEMAETGQLQSYIGTGFTHDGLRVSTWANYHSDKFQVLGSLAWLQTEYIERVRAKQ